MVKNLKNNSDLDESELFFKLCLFEHLHLLFEVGDLELAVLVEDSFFESLSIKRILFFLRVELNRICEHCRIGCLEIDVLYAIELYEIFHDIELLAIGHAIF